MHDNHFVTALFGFSKVSSIKDPSKTNGTIQATFLWDDKTFLEVKEPYQVGFGFNYAQTPLS